MNTQTTPTSPATIPATQQMPPPGITAQPQPTQAPGATGAIPTPTPNPTQPAPQVLPTEAPITPEPQVAVNEKPITPILLWYAVGTIAYALAFNKAYQDIQTSADGNGLFISQDAGIVTKDKIVPQENLKLGKQEAETNAENATPAVEAVMDNNVELGLTPRDKADSTKKETLTKLGISEADEEI